MDEQYDLTMLNTMMECEGGYTWSMVERKNVIDYCLVNTAFIKDVLSIGMDDNKEVKKSYHSLLTVNFNIGNNLALTFKKSPNRKEYIEIIENTKNAKLSGRIREII